VAGAGPSDPTKMMEGHSTWLAAGLDNGEQPIPQCHWWIGLTTGVPTASVGHPDRDASLPRGKGDQQ
jgi:hypothetical protein